MKWIAIALSILTIILAALYSTIGGTVLAIALGTISLTTIMMCLFSVGVWYAHKSIQLGAKLAAEAQNNNDHWDTVKMQALSRFGVDMLKLRSEQNPDGYPLLETGNDAQDGSFTIQGIDEEVKQ